MHPDHLLEVKHGNTSTRVLNALRGFLFRKLLNWIELSSLMGQVDIALTSLKVVLTWFTVSGDAFVQHAAPHHTLRGFKVITTTFSP
jgi:hypothetical protein